VPIPYCLQVTLKNRLMIRAPGLTPTAVLEKVATIQMVEVWIPMIDGRWLVMPPHTQPDKDVQAVLDHLPPGSAFAAPAAHQSSAVRRPPSSTHFVVKTFGSSERKLNNLRCAKAANCETPARIRHN
jgi:hypothetical protein